MTRLFVTRPHLDPLDVHDARDLKVLPSGVLAFIEETSAGPVTRLIAPDRWAEVFTGQPGAIGQATP